MSKKPKKLKYGEPINPEEMPKPRKRLPEYDECLREFLESGQTCWRVNLKALPSKNNRVILSSLKWRIRNKPEFKDIQVVMSKNQIYLEKVKRNE
jgi:hypothetical protein